MKPELYYAIRKQLDAHNPNKLFSKASTNLMLRVKMFNRLLNAGILRLRTVQMDLLSHPAQSQGELS